MAQTGRRTATIKKERQRLYSSRDRRRMRRAAIKKADAEAIQIKGTQREQKGNNNKASSC